MATHNSKSFFYQPARLPKNYRLLQRINFAARKLFEKLKNLDISALDISEYNESRLTAKQRRLRASLARFSYILAWSTAYIDVPLNDFVFIEYGGGTGLGALLAREIGIGTVIYNDIYDVSCEDARIIAQEVNNEADYYHRGDIDDLVSFIKNSALHCNAVASNDVIEHIYDIERFLISLEKLTAPPCNIVMSTGANPNNPRIRKRLMRKQIRTEYQDRGEIWGQKKTDTRKAYFQIRKEIIRRYAPSLSGKEVEDLAKATRGLIESEIRKRTYEYINNGEMPSALDHPTNTCDPYTGSWAEHLMDINKLRNILLNKNFEVAVLSGYYVDYSDDCIKNPMKKAIGFILNSLINQLNEKALIFAPFYTIYARKTIQTNKTIPAN